MAFIINMPGGSPGSLPKGWKGSSVTDAPTPGVSTPEEIAAWYYENVGPMGPGLPGAPAPGSKPPTTATASRPVPGWLLLGAAGLLGWWFLK